MTPRLLLSLEGEIAVDVLAKPRAVTFGEVLKGSEPPVKSLELEVAEPERVKVSSVTSSDERFEVTLQAGEPAGSGTYEVRLRSTAELGAIQGKIHVATDGADALDVAVSATVVGDLRYPKSVSMFKSKEQYPPREVTLESRTGREVEIKRAEDPDGALAVELKQPKGKKAVLKVSVAESAIEGPPVSQGKLRIETNDPDERTVEIAYTIQRSRPGAQPPLPRRAPGLRAATPAVPSPTAPPP